MTYNLSENIHTADQLFKSFEQHGKDITGLEMIGATLTYAANHQLNQGDICILIDSLISTAGVRVVSALLNPILDHEIPADISEPALEAIHQVAARARAAVLELKEANYKHPEWETWDDTKWLQEFGDKAWKERAAEGYTALSAVEYERCRPRFLEMLHTMEGHYCVVNEAEGASLIQTEGIMSGYNSDLNYNTQETVCDSSGFCRLINLDETNDDNQRYNDEWALDYVVEYTNHEKPGETMQYEANRISHANDNSNNAMMNDDGEWVDFTDRGISSHHGDYCEYNPRKRKQN